MTDRSQSSVAAYGSDAWVALRFGRTVQWFRQHRAALEIEGFPRKDRLVGMTLKADVDAWLARRRTVADADAVQPDTHHTTKPTDRQLHGL